MDDTQQDLLIVLSKDGMAQARLHSRDLVQGFRQNPKGFNRSLLFTSPGHKSLQPPRTVTVPCALMEACRDGDNYIFYVSQVHLQGEATDATAPAEPNPAYNQQRAKRGVTNYHIYNDPSAPQRMVDHYLRVLPGLGVSIVNNTAHGNNNTVGNDTRSTYTINEDVLRSQATVGEIMDYLCRVVPPEILDRATDQANNPGLSRLEFKTEMRQLKAEMQQMLQSHTEDIREMLASIRQPQQAPPNEVPLVQHQPTSGADALETNPTGQRDEMEVDGPSQ